MSIEKYEGVFEANQKILPFKIDREKKQKEFRVERSATG